MEAIGGKTLVTEVEHGFLVMTNFPNGRFAGRSYDEVEGIGADRYVTAYKAIARGGRTRLGFRRPWQSCMTPPSHTVQCAPLYVHWCSIRLATMCMWFVPGFERVWRVSLEERLIETYSGFSEHVSLPLGQDGIPASELMKYR